MAAERETTTPPDPEATRLLPRADTPGGLPAGTRLREFEIERVIGEGGFSIVYAAGDVNLHRRVALKEYMPAALARRCDDRTVQPRSSREAETFALGRRSFINEARLLAQFDHPSLVKVHQFWEENGTAYMVMPLYEGRTLKQWLKEAGPPAENELAHLLVPLLDALEHLHAASVFHRDVAPDNVLLLEDGRPVLLDFGAARRVLADSNKALTAILKPSYAPLEQHADMAQLRQGPWTDVYALCAVLYYAVTGSPPPSAIGRSISDRMVPAAKAASGRYSARFLRAIDAGLAVRPEARPQSIAELRKLLLGSGPPTVGRPPGAEAVPARRQGVRRSAALAVGGLALAVGLATWWVLGGNASAPVPAESPAARASSPAGGAAPPSPVASRPQPAAPTTPPTSSTVGGPPPSAPSAQQAPTPPPSPASADRTAPAPPSATAAQQPVSAPAGDRAAATTSPAPAFGALTVERAAAAPGGPPPAVQRSPGASPRLDAARAAVEPPARARCLRIVQRMQLGEMPNEEEKAFLKKECT
jgi:serine/threonine protein kinase